MNSSTKRKKTKERDNKNNDCNQTWLQKAKQHNILQFLQLKILSVNCQGLGNIVKRTDVFNYLKKKQCNIYCLQDTHFTRENEKSIRSSWDYECYFSSFTSNARGTAILFNNNFEFNILKEKRDINGNYLVLDINVDKINFTSIERKNSNLACLNGFFFPPNIRITIWIKVPIRFRY
jgi:hypothetical protein